MKMLSRLIAVWAISNLYRAKPSPEWDLVAGGVPLLCQLILNVEDCMLLANAW